MFKFPLDWVCIHHGREFGCNAMEMRTSNFNICRMIKGNDKKFIVIEYGVNLGPVEMDGFRYTSTGVSEDTDVCVLSLLLVKRILIPSISGHTR